MRKGEWIDCGMRIADWGLVEDKRQMTDVRRQRTEDRGQKTDVRGQMSEDRCQRTERR